MDTLLASATRFQQDNMVIAYTSAAFVALVAIVQLDSWQKHRKFEQIYGKASFRPLFNPLGPFGYLLEGWMMRLWKQRLTIYKNSKRELLVLEPTIYGTPLLYSNSVEVLRQIAGAGTPTGWWKAPWISMPSLYWGPNVLSSNDVEWKKHRRIMQPAFNPEIYRLVWDETKRLYDEMITADRWPLVPGQTKTLLHAKKSTQRLALCVILACGFGLPLGWAEDAYDTGGNTVNLDEGIRFQADNVILVCYAPKWVLALPLEKMRYITKCTASLRSWFNQAVLNRKAEITQAREDGNGEIDMKSLRKDVFTRLTLAGQMDSRDHLEDNEIIGNTWVMYFAGHESTAGALAATLCLLASHKEEQDAVLEEIMTVSGHSSDGTLGFDQYNSLIKTRSSFVEAVRMYPAGYAIIREAREDTILQVPAGTRADGTIIEEAIHIPKGTIIAGDMIGAQYNPRLFPNPEAFKPSRWYDTTSDDAFTAFSIGPRTCIGRKFALSESVCFLAHLLRDYEVSPLLAKGETLEAWKERILDKVDITLALTISDAPLVFKRRSQR